MTERTIVPVRVQNVMDMEILRMNVWSIKFNSSSVMVSGFVRTPDGNSMNLVTSEAICKRMNSTLLFDISGRFYELLGQIDKSTQLKAGMSSRVMEEFLNGFPDNWVFLVGQCLTTEQRSAIRPIQAAPREPIRPKSPIVTLADETELREQGKAQKEQKEDADATFRAPTAFFHGAVTPIRFTRGNGATGRSQRVFESTPSREPSSSRPLASSTPQPQKLPVLPPVAPRDVPAAQPRTFATDDDLFAVPKLPASSSGLDFLEDMEAIFNGAHINRTPSHAAPRARVPREFRSRSPSYEQRYQDRRYQDESRVSRKRGMDRSPEYYEMERRAEESRRSHESKRARPRETSSSSGRSVRFEETYRRDRHHQNDRSHRSHHYEQEKEHKRRLREIERREREVEERLKRNRKVSSDSNSSSGEEDGSFNEWDVENREILDRSLMEASGRERRPKREPTSKKSTSKKPAAPKPKPTKNIRKKRDPIETDDPLNTSIASSRPRRACATPATKKITWPRRDLDRLKRVLEMKAPTGRSEDWVEVARLLAKDGVNSEEVRQIAESKLRWKEPEHHPEEHQEDPLNDSQLIEKKRRNGIAARVKESVKMAEELQTRPPNSDEMRGRVEEVEEYQPADVSADESLLALSTPQVIKKRGGTRKSTLPEPIEDSPMARGANSSVNSPRLNATKAKEQETTLRYVQHLTTMQTRPASRMNKSAMNKSTASAKNTSMTVEQGTRHVQKMMKKAMAIDEEEEDDEESDENQEETSFY